MKKVRPVVARDAKELAKVLGLRVNPSLPTTSMILSFQSIAFDVPPEALA